MMWIKEKIDEEDEVLLGELVQIVSDDRFAETVVHNLQAQLVPSATVVGKGVSRREKKRFFKYHKMSMLEFNRDYDSRQQGIPKHMFKRCSVTKKYEPCIKCPMNYCKDRIYGYVTIIKNYNPKLLEHEYYFY